MIDMIINQQDYTRAVSHFESHQYSECLHFIQTRFDGVDNLPDVIRMMKVVCLENAGNQAEAAQILQTFPLADQFWLRRASYDDTVLNGLIDELNQLGQGMFDCKPKVINLQVNDICNSKCVMCNIWTKKLDVQIGPHDLETILSAPFFSEVESVGVTGGEPTIRDDLLDLHNVLVNTLAGLKSTTFITNGFLVDKAIRAYSQIYSLYQQNGKYFGGMVSVDGVGELHDRVRGKKSAFIRAENTLFQLRDLGVPVHACCTIVKENVFGLHDLLSWGNKNGIYIRYRIAEFINRLYNSELTTQIRNFEWDEIKHLASFLYLLIETYETDETIISTYKSILSILSGQSRITKCPYQYSYAVNIDSRGNFELCAPKGTPHPIRPTNDLLRQFQEVSPERFSILHNYCPDCIHDYHDRLKPAEDWISKSAGYYDHLMYDFSNIHLLEGANTSITIDFAKIKKILLVGWYGTETAGDIAILGGILQELLAKKPHLNFIVFSLFPSYTRITIKDLPESIYSHIEVRGYHGPLAYDAVYACDAIIMAGGPLMDLPQTRMIADLFFLFKKQNKPAIIEGCGIGPLNIPLYKENVSIILKLADRISVRDQDSKSLISTLAAGKEIWVRQDPSTTYIDSSGIKYIGSESKVIRCFLRELTHEYPQNVSPQVASDQIVEFLGNLLNWYPDYRVELWSMHYFPVGNDDREYAKILCVQLANPRVSIEIHPKSPIEILTAMAEARFSVCMRYHSVIFASKIGAPYVAIDYTAGGKVYSYLKETDQLSRMVSLADLNGITFGKFQCMLDDNSVIPANDNSYPLKVIHLNTSDNKGGAAIAAFRLNEGLRNLGVDSKMLVRFKESEDSSVIRVEPDDTSSFRGTYLSDVFQKEFIDNNRTEISNTLFTWPLVGQDVSEVGVIQACDVINLHWLSFFQSLETLEKLADLNKPIVWTIHDQWPFTGGCHYSAGCLKYETECTQCPQLIDHFDTTKHIFSRKKDVIRNLNPVIVSPSRWLADCARRSEILRDLRIEVMPNALNPDIFKPLPKSDARRLLNLDEHGYYMLFGVDNLVEKRKGFSLLIEALKISLLDEKFHGWVDDGKIRILTFGTPASELIDLRIPVITLGYLCAENEVVNAFAASDIFILPSLEENLPNTVLEAMSCGRPVIAFATGGIPELIDDGETGFLIQIGNLDELSGRIIELANDPELTEKMGLAGRRKILRDFTQEVQATRYLELYKQLVASPLPVTSEVNTISKDVVYVRTLLPEQTNEATSISIANKIFSDLTEQINQRDQWLEELNGRIADLTGQVDERNMWLEEQKQLIDELSEQVDQRNQWLEELNGRIADLTGQVDERNMWLEEQNERIADLSEQADQLNRLKDAEHKWISEASSGLIKRCSKLMSKAKKFVKG